MPKVLQAYNSDYKIVARESGTITLDTGIETGTVVVTGNLQVQGNTTTIDTVNLEIEDNILVLNRGEQGSGVSENTAGIEIDRGSLPSARWIFDEQITWTLGGLSGVGSFYSESGGQKLPITTPGIVAQGNFYIDTGAGVISVTNVPNYEEGIFNYNNGEIEPDANGFIVIDNDNIPNAKAVKDYIDYNFDNRFQNIVAEGNTSLETIDDSHPLFDIVSINESGNDTTVLQTTEPHGLVEGDFIDITGINANGDPLENLNGTSIEVLQIINQNVFRIDAAVIGADVTEYVQNSGTVTKTSFEESRIKIQVQGNSIADFYNNRFDVGSLEFKDTQIQTTESNSDLILKSSGAGSVKIDDILEIKSIPYDDDFNTIPQAPSSSIKLFSNNPNTGKTGLYYINTNSTTDEFISKNRSLLFSMLF
jgi:hypothetical protein